MVRTFTIPQTGGGGTTNVMPDGGDGAGAKGINLSSWGLMIPVTGFAPGQITKLPARTAEMLFTTDQNLHLEIPSLNFNQPIVGIPYKDNSWDVKWLDDNVGYLEGSAYPTWTGNTVLTGHSTDANENAITFGYIRELSIGDKIMIHSNGQVYVYQVKDNRLIQPSSIEALFKHEDYSWITLVTCENFNADLGKFTSRRMVRAVLISVIPDK
jgi:LPXTG-site transpeptidase (sortase) family protein